MKGPCNQAGNEGGENDTDGSPIATEQRGPMARGINRFDRLSVGNQGCKYDERDQSRINTSCKDTVAGRRGWCASVGRAREMISPINSVQHCNSRLIHHD